MKIFCIGRNYAEHAKELNNEVPQSPVIFMKPPTALLLKNRPFYHPDFSQDIHHEVELVLRVCKNGRSVQPEFAHRYYDAVALGIDFTARDLQADLKKKGLPWEIAKAFDRSAPLGEFVGLGTLPEGAQRIRFSLKKNGTTVQEGDTTDLIFPFDSLICHISRYFTLNKGDYIFTGTPSGVGPVKAGDLLEAYLEGNLNLSCQIR